MASNRLALAALGIACVAAAAGGSYVATRHNAADRQAFAASAPAQGPTDPQAGPTALPAEEAVTEPLRPAVSNAASTPVAENKPAPAQPRVPPVRPSTPKSTKADKRIEPPAPVPAQAAAAPALPSAIAPIEAAPFVARDERPLEPSIPAEPAQPALEELTVAADSVIGLQTENALSSERARVEDRVEARVVRDVRANGRVAIPAGSRVFGSVVVVERGGRARNRARLGIRFHTLALPDGTRLPISTETIYRYGNDPANGSAAKIGGGAVAGAILGAIIGGGKGAAIGATTGAAGGGAAVMAGERSEAVFPSGAELTARIVSPVTITAER